MIQKQLFFSWLIGLTEGDGSFIKNKNGYLKFKITQSSEDVQILYLIQDQLGFGYVSVKDKNQKTHHYRVRKKEHLLFLIHLFNGSLLTEKAKIRFKNWVCAFNQKYKAKIVLKHPLKWTSPNLKNSWLCGFTDAEGCFNVTLINRFKTYIQVQVRFILSQKGELEILNKFTKLFGGKISYLKSYNGFNMTVNLLKLQTVIEYFERHPLKTRKEKTFQYWKGIY